MQPLKVQAPFSTLHFKSISRRISPCCVFSSLMTSHVAGKLRSIREILFRSARLVYATERLHNISIKKEFLIDNWVTLKEFLIDNWQLVERFMFDCDGDSRRIKKKISLPTRGFQRRRGSLRIAVGDCKRCAKKMISHALVLNDTRMVRATLRVYLVKESAMHSLTLELVTVGDFALPVAGLFVHVKGQSAGARDLLQAGPCTPGGTGTENRGCLRESNSGKKTCRLLSSWSQFFTFVFQSQVCRSMSKARPVGHRTVASLVTPISLALSHLGSFSHSHKPFLHSRKADRSNPLFTK